MDVVELAKRLKELEDNKLELNANRSANNKIQVTVQTEDRNFMYTMNDLSTEITDLMVTAITKKIEDLKKEISETLYPIRNEVPE